MECSCVFKNILTGYEAICLRGLLESIDKKAAVGGMLGVIDTSKRKGRAGCPHKFNWGHETYCDNQVFIAQYIKEHKDEFPWL